MIHPDKIQVPSASEDRPSRAVMVTLLIGDSNAAGFYQGNILSGTPAQDLIATASDRDGNLLESPVEGVTGMILNKWDSTPASFDDTATGFAPRPVTNGDGIINGLGAGGIGPEFSLAPLQYSLYERQGMEHMMVKVAVNGATAGPAPGDAPALGEWDPSLRTGTQLYSGLLASIAAVKEWADSEDKVAYIDGVVISLGGNDALDDGKTQNFKTNLTRLIRAMVNDFSIDPNRIAFLAVPTYLAGAATLPSVDNINAQRGTILGTNLGRSQSVDYSSEPIQEDYIHLQPEGYYNLGLYAARVLASRSGFAARID